MRAAALIVSLLAACSAGRRPGPSRLTPGLPPASIEDGGERRLDARPPMTRDATYLDPTCETATIEAGLPPLVMLLSVDTSGSMNCNARSRSCAIEDPTPAPDDSRWDVLREVLSETVAALPATVSVGLMTYPDGHGCASATPLVPIDSAPDVRARLDRATMSLVPDGITPTHDAVLVAFDAIQRTDAPDEAPRVVVLATDGAATVCAGCDPGCDWDALDRDHLDMIDDVAAARALGVRTFVIGVPGSDPFRDILSRMAEAGGTAPEGCSSAGPHYCHFDVADRTADLGSALREAFADVRAATLPCVLAIPENDDGAFDPNKLNVRVIDEAGASTIVPRDAAHIDGWDYAGDGEHVELHGNACDRARTATKIELAFGCPTELI